MKLQKLTILIVTLLLVVVSCGKNSKADYSAKRAELMYMYNEFLKHKPIPKSPKVDSLFCFFEAQGTPDDLLLSSYCKGASLYQKNCRKAAYLELRNAYSKAPEKLSPQSREVVCGILSYLQYMCAIDCNLSKAEFWWRTADSLKIHTDENLYSHYYDRATLYFYNQDMDSSNVYIQKSLENMLLYPKWDENKRGCLSNIVIYYAVIGNNAKFKNAYALLQKHPYHGEDANLNYYYGLVRSQEGSKDSANTYFRKALKDPEHALAAAIQLGISARNRQEHDTVFYYFQKCVTLYDSIVEAQGNSYSRDVDVLYETHEKEQKIAEQRIALLQVELAFLVALLFAVVSAWLVFVYRKHLMKTRRQLDVEQKKREEVEKRLQEILDEMVYKQTISEEETAKKKFEAILHELACIADARMSASTEQLADFVAIFATLHPDACARMKSNYPRIKSTDYVICALAKYNFKQSQIAKLLDRENSEIYHFMLRISKGLTGEAIGRMADFKVMLEERIFAEDKQ